MKIRTMFKDDIEREINGVIKVNQNEESVIEQEVREYVVTNELRGHFEKFFSNYNKSFSAPVENIGVWIQGFFGSGKSHFLKTAKARWHISRISLQTTRLPSPK